MAYKNRLFIILSIYEKTVLNDPCHPEPFSITTYMQFEPGTAGNHQCTRREYPKDKPIRHCRQHRNHRPQKALPHVADRFPCSKGPEHSTCYKASAPYQKKTNRLQIRSNQKKHPQPRWLVPRLM